MRPLCSRRREWLEIQSILFFWCLVVKTGKTFVVQWLKWRLRYQVSTVAWQCRFKAAQSNCQCMPHWVRWMAWPFWWPQGQEVLTAHAVTPLRRMPWTLSWSCRVSPSHEPPSRPMKYLMTGSSRCFRRHVHSKMPWWLQDKEGSDQQDTVNQHRDSSSLSYSACLHHCPRVLGRPGALLECEAHLPQWYHCLGAWEAAWSSCKSWTSPRNQGIPGNCRGPPWPPAGYTKSARWQCRHRKRLQVSFSLRRRRPRWCSVQGHCSGEGSDSRSPATPECHLAGSLFQAQEYQCRGAWAVLQRDNSSAGHTLPMGSSEKLNPPIPGPWCWSNREKQRG